MIFRKNTSENLSKFCKNTPTSIGGSMSQPNEKRTLREVNILYLFVLHFSDKFRIIIDRENKEIQVDAEIQNQRF